MRQQFIDSGCPVRIINGMPDRVHSLFLLNPQKAITEIIKQIKGATSHWMNEKFDNRKNFRGRQDMPPIQ